MESKFKSIYGMNNLDEIGRGDTIIHKINPLVKMIVTIIYLVVVLSFHKYSVSQLIPYVFYPVIIIVLGEIPPLMVLKRILYVMPFIIILGISNPIFDKTGWFMINGIIISKGWLSFFSLVIKCILTVTAGIIFIGTTKVEDIALALRKIYIPKIMVTQIILTYRYISVLGEEVDRIKKAYSLRSPLKPKISIKDLGSILGQMLLRSFDRANRIYDAMLLRGFHGEYDFGTYNRLDLKSFLYFIGWIALFFILRFLNLSQVIGNIFIWGLPAVTLPPF